MAVVWRYRPRSGLHYRWCALAAWAALTISCHTGPRPQAGAASPPPPAAVSLTTSATAPQGLPARDAPPQTQLRLSPANLVLPAAPPHASRAVGQFYAAAIRAVRHTYEDDIDDPSLLEALTARLQRDPSLQSAQTVWLPALNTAQRRAATLRVLGPTLRALRQALVNAWRDELAQTYRDVDTQACRAAILQMPAEPGDRDTPLQETVVTIEPFGTYLLLTFLRFCEDSRSFYAHEFR